MMSTPYGLSAPLYVHSGQTDFHPVPFSDSYSPARVIRSPSESQMFWDPTTQQHASGPFSPVSFPGNTIGCAVNGTQFMGSDSEEDKDEFVTFGTCVSLRGERSAYDPMQPNYSGTSELEDTLANVPLSAGLEAEEECDEEMLKTMQNGLPVPDTVDYVRLARENELLRKENLRLHELNETYEAKQYTQNGEALLADNVVGEDGDDQIEEIIEEEVHTIKHARPSIGTAGANQVQQEFTEYIERQDEATQSALPGRRNVGTGNWNVQQHHMIDLSAPMIDETQFPASYWSRLEELFYNRFCSNRPITRELGIQTRETTHRTTATMAVPLTSTPRERHCFGVSVSPIMQSVGVMCPQVSTREFGCTTVESAAVVQDWIDNRLVGVNDTTRKLVQRLFKSSMHSRDEFLETILQVVKRDLRHVGLQIKPEQRSQFAFTRSERLVSTASGDNSRIDETEAKQTESKLVEARPVQSNRSTVTHHIMGTSVSCETEAPLLRSQGAQAVPEVPDVTACSVQVGQAVHTVDQALDPIFSQTRQATIGIQVDAETSETKVFMTKSAEEVERMWQSRSERSSSHAQSGQVYQNNQIGQIEYAVKEQLTDKEVVEPNIIPSRREGTSGEHRISDSLRQSAPYWQNTSGSSESYTVSTERRMVDELSERHLLPSDVDLEELSRGGPEALDAILVRAKDLGTTHVVREFQPEVEVYHSIQPHSPFKPTTPAETILTSELFPGTPSTSGPSTDTIGFQIPVIHSPSPVGGSATHQVRSIPVERLGATHSPTLVTRLDSVPKKKSVVEPDPKPSTSTEKEDTMFHVSRTSRPNSFRSSGEQSKTTESRTDVISAPDEK
ncbi:unnamed protein product [Echinostoma caproni]|uniref:Histone acetyltransferase n=1 Tax=Echinostoma caproni TaxID=27848 RepID=A0A183AZU5_9TREM|nr:unnamed protein product [Echinostoma caproni]